SEEHTSELQSLTNLVCRLLLEKKNPPSEPWPRAMSTAIRATYCDAQAVTLAGTRARGPQGICTPLRSIPVTKTHGPCPPAPPTTARARPRLHFTSLPSRRLPESPCTEERSRLPTPWTRATGHAGLPWLLPLCVAQDSFRVFFYFLPHPPGSTLFPTRPLSR